MPDPADALQAPRNALRGAADSHLGPATLALAGAGLLAAAKWGLHVAGWEVLDTGLPILTALLGAVVFTLAIVLAGVLADFKEAERALGELVSVVRRLHWDFATSGIDPAGLQEVRGQLIHFVEMVRENARHGFRWRLRDLHTPIDTMDRLLITRMERPLPTTRSTQVGLATLTRTVDRLEVIVETTFMQAGYVFSGVSLALLMACFLLSPLGGAATGPLLVGAIAFVLGGLYLLVRDLDNPLAGSVRVDLRQVEKLAKFLRERQAGEAGESAGRVEVRQA